MSYTNSLKQTFLLISNGIFTMGSPLSEPGRENDEGPQHQVKLTQHFYMQVTEVTQEQWEKVMGSNPSEFSGCANCPVEQVSWNDVQDYISKLNTMGEGTYRLPTEAEWEYAARAGTSTAFPNGDITHYDDMSQCNSDANLNAMGWYCYNAKSKTHPVAYKRSNPWGLFDMHGNVYEWCEDWKGDYPSGLSTDPKGAASGIKRVLRGGSWDRFAKYSRSANRSSWEPGDKSGNFGFRLIRQP